MKTINSSEESREVTRDTVKLKKKLIIIIISVVAVIAVLFAVSFAIDRYYDKEAEQTEGPIDYNFYPADYSEDIYKDVDYVEKIDKGFIYYTDYDTNITVGIEKDTAVDHGDSVMFMVDFVYSIINGDFEGYNGFFSDAYYENNVKHEAFTMQKLYDVNIIKESSTVVTDGDSDYTKYVFVLDYKIFKNNGTFRNDIGDGSKKQYITVTDRSGELKIDSITTAKYR